MHWKVVLGLVYAVLGLYLINSSQNFVEIPELISQFEVWTFLIAGILLVFSALGYFMSRKEGGKQKISVG